MSSRPLVLTIGALHLAADDGIVADAAVLSELGCTPLCAATSVVPRPGSDPVPVPEALLAVQLDAGLAESPRAIRVGTLSGEREVEALAERLASREVEAIVLAPEPSARRACLLPFATVVVVRGGELRDLEGLERLAARHRAEGATAVLVAGASLRGRVVDLLDDGGRITVLDTSRIQAPRVPGLAGSHATALAAHLARGETLPAAAEAAQRYVALRLRRGR